MSSGSMGPAQRSRLACDTCRRKKIKCPGEKPICSSCSRLGQVCTWCNVKRVSRSSKAMEDRLELLEARLNDMTRDSGKPTGPVHDGTRLQENDGELMADDIQSFPQDVPFSQTSKTSPSASLVNEALQIYYDRCHRHPIWLFNAHEVGQCSDVADEVALAVLALASHFEPAKFSYQGDLKSARRLVMSQLADGNVRLSTIEALCLISQSCFLAGELSIGRFHVSLGLQLCRVASLDVASGYHTKGMVDERKKRAFWSLNVLQLYHGENSAPTNIVEYLRLLGDESDCDDHQTTGRSLPSIPTISTDDSMSSDPDIWNVLIQLACAWSRARSFVSSCITDKVQEPWNANSTYAQVLADLTAAESRTPMCHRWQTVKFCDQSRDAIAKNGQYWKPWLSTQFTWHLVLTIMNHPFLYMAAAQYNKRLAVLNTFWTRSSQLVMLHATWLVRLADMAQDRQMTLSDPLFGQAAAIAATVHLYYLSAPNQKTKRRSASDLLKGKRFLEKFRAFSPLCAALDARLERLLQAALGADWKNLEANLPTQVSLNARLMWEVLELACSNSSAIESTACNGLLHWSLASTNAIQSQRLEEVLFEVRCTVSPDVTDDTSDGGQSAPITIPVAASSLGVPSALSYPGMATPVGTQTLSSEAMENDPGSSWLYGGNRPPNTSVHTFDVQTGVFLDAENTAWWDWGNF